MKEVGEGVEMVEGRENGWGMKGVKDGVSKGGAGERVEMER
jgi:hypothetical protein